MAFIEANIPPQKVLVRKGFLFDDPEAYPDEYESGVLISVRCLEGSAALFQVLFENGRMRDKLPIHALSTDEVPTEAWRRFPFHYLQLWDCFSKTFSIIELNYVYNAKVDVLLKDGSTVSGHYLWTIQWASNAEQVDLTYAQDPSEHKAHHFIELDNGLFALQPNNRITRWHEPSLVTKHPAAEDKWKVNTMEWCCEQHTNWTTEDSNAYMYRTEGEEKETDRVEEEEKGGQG